MNATLPNAFTPLAFLPPDVATQLEASRYLYVAATGAYIWDFLMSLPEEYELIFRHRMRYTQAAYIAARLISMGFIVTCVVFQVAAVGNCHVLAKIIGWFAAFAIPANTLLFFFRVRAVFSPSSWIVAIFAFLWLATFTGLGSPFGVDGAHIGGPGHVTNRCVNTDVKPFSSAGMIAGTFHDTIVFISIACRLMTFNLTATTWSARFRAFWSGEGFGHLSRTLLQSGQLYYLVTVAVNLLTIVMILTPSVPPVYQAMFAMPNVALENAMACRVYRKLKLGLIQDHPSIISTGTSHTKGAPSTIRFKRSQASSTVIDSLNTHNSTGVRVNEDKSIPMMRIDVNQVTEVAVGDQEDLKRRSEDWKRGDMSNAV